MIETHSTDEREILFPLFKNNKYDIVVMKSVLYGLSGTAYSDSKTNPTVCRLDSGAYTILGGNPDSEHALQLIRHAPINVVTPENAAWEKLLYNEFNDKITYQPFCSFLPPSLNKNHLQELTLSIGSDFKILRINQVLARQLHLDIDNSYFFEHFSSYEDFSNRGIGFCVTYKNKIVSAVTSMAAAEKLINIEIETLTDFRNKNLATAVCATLLLYCLENNITPQWLAANHKSEMLAEKLGYLKDDSYKTFIIQSQE